MSVDASSLPSPIRGLCYQPAPTDYVGNQGPGQKYFDTDFFNTDFPGFWSKANGGRGDLANMADLGVNFIHLYDWNAPPQRDHTTFLKECSAQGITVAVPLNNSFAQNVTSWGANAVSSVMKEVYTTLGTGTVPYGAVGMWTIANEYNQGGGPSAAQIAQVAQVILYVETQLGATTVLPISSPTSFAPAEDPGIQPTQALQAAFASTTAFSATIDGHSVTIPALSSDFFATRYLAATNPQNPGSIPPASSGVTIASWLPQFAAALPGTPVWFSELGIGVQNSCNGWGSSCTPSSTQQATFESNQLASADPVTYDYLLGSCIFEYTPDYQNPIGSNNYTFALLSDDTGTSPAQAFTIPSTAPAGGGDTYPVQVLYTSNPVYAAIRAIWNPNGGTMPTQFGPASPTAAISADSAALGAVAHPGA